MLSHISCYVKGRIWLPARSSDIISPSINIAGGEWTCWILRMTNSSGLHVLASRSR